MVDIYLEIEGIQGDSVADHHLDAIDGISWKWGVERCTVTSGGGVGAGKVSFQDLSITKHLDSSSPALIEACATGRRLKKAVLYVTRRGERPTDVLILTLHDVGVEQA